LDPTPGRSFSRFVSRVLGRRAPEFRGRAIRILFRTDVPSGAPGTTMHAATFIRERRIILAQELQTKPKELARILTHEIFHFAWVRLSNESRAAYAALLLDERRLHARGELGWSAESRKMSLPSRRSIHQTSKWREYACESFCDTAAWLYSGVRRHNEFTLSPRHRTKRAAWFQKTFPTHFRI